MFEYLDYMNLNSIKIQYSMLLESLDRLNSVKSTYWIIRLCLNMVLKICSFVRKYWNLQIKTVLDQDDWTIKSHWYVYTCVQSRYVRNCRNILINKPECFSENLGLWLRTLTWTEDLYLDWGLGLRTCAWTEDLGLDWGLQLRTMCFCMNQLGAWTKVWPRKDE